MQLEQGRPPPKIAVRIVVGLVITSQALALGGELLFGEFVDQRPALLIALNPRIRNLLLATNQLDALTFYAVGFARLVASDPLYYLLGFWYGRPALAWIGRQSETLAAYVDQGERIFRGASYPIIFLAPNNIVCALSATTAVRLRTFIFLNLAGTVARLVLIRQLGEVFEGPLDSILDFIARYRVPVLVLSAIFVGFTVMREFRSDTSQLRALRNLAADPDHGLDSDQEAAAGDGPEIGPDDRSNGVADGSASLLDREPERD